MRIKKSKFYPFKGLLDGNIFTSRMMTEVMNIAEEIAKKSPVAVQGTKVSLVYARDHSVQDGLNQIVS